MMRARSPRWLPAFQYLAGLSDSSTGLLLIFAPARTLALMSVRVLPQPIEFASFIGVFVLGVGLTYFLVPVHGRPATQWQTVWLITALMRTLITVFLLAEMLAGRLEHAWFTVAITDGALAAFQWFGLAKGWFDVAA